MGDNDSSMPAHVFVCVHLGMCYIQHLATPLGFSPPVQQQPWRWPSLCPPEGAWSRLWVTAAPCTRGPAGALQEGKKTISEM